MKTKHYILTGVSVYLCSLIYLAPAKTIIDLVIADNANLSLSGVEGSLWNGSAENARFNKHQIDKLSWSFSAWRLLTAKLSYDVNGFYKDNSFVGTIGYSPTNTFSLNDFSTTIDAYTVGQLAGLPVGELGGTIEIDINKATWSQNTIPYIQGKTTWDQASITVVDKADLGEVVIEIDEDDTSPITAKINNTPGDLTIDGNAIVSEQGDYQLDISLKPASKANQNLRNSLKMIAKPLPDGSYKIVYKGDLSQLGLM